MLLLKIPPETSDKLPYDIRDRFGRRLRRAALAQLEDLHIANANNPDKPSLGWGVEGYFGPMGFGKTCTAIGRMAEAYASGYKVVSINAGALFGYTLQDPRDFFLLLQSGIHDCVVMADEIHALMSSAGSMTIRQRTAIEAGAGGRKMQIPQVYMSQNERATAGALKGLINWVFYPQPVAEETWQSKLGYNSSAAGFDNSCYIDLHRYGPDPYEDRQGTVAQAHGLELKGSVGYKDRLLWPAAVDSWQRLYWSFTPVTVGLTHDLSAAAIRGRYADADYPVWSDELTEDEQTELFNPQHVDDATANPVETPREKAGRLVSDCLLLLHERELDPEEPRLPVARLVANLRDFCGWNDKEARRLVSEYLDPSGSPPQVKTVKIAGYFAPEIWQSYVIDKEEMPDD